MILPKVNLKSPKSETSVNITHPIELKVIAINRWDVGIGGGNLPRRRPLLATSMKRAAICRYRVESANDSLNVAETQRSTHIKWVFHLEPAHDLHGCVVVKE